MKRGPKKLAVKLSFPAVDGRLDGWGWLTELSAAGARLSTLAELRRGQRLHLEFELNGERFADFSVEARWGERDVDGYWDAELVFCDQVQRRALSRSILDVLARSL